MINTLNYELRNSISCFVSNKILFDDENQTGFSKAKIEAINLYKGEAASFTVLLDDGSLFDYVTPNYIWLSEKLEEQLSLKDLVYNNNISETFVINEYQFIKKYENTEKLNCFFKGSNKWMRVKEYVLTIDWLYDNDKRHLVILENNQIAFVPNHKILIGTKKLEFKPYKKIRNTFKV